MKTALTARAFMRLGVSISWPSPDVLEIHGNGLDGLREPGDIIDVGNSGTGIRLITECWLVNRSIQS